MGKDKAYKKLIKLLTLEKQAEVEAALIELARQKLELKRLRRYERLQKIIHKRKEWKQYVC